MFYLIPYVLNTYISVYLTKINLDLREFFYDSTFLYFKNINKFQTMQEYINDF